MSERAKRSFGYSLLDYIHDEVKLQIGSECPKDFVKYCLEEKEAIVIFDGLDEVANISDRKFVRDMIMKFKESYPKARYLVTSRIYGYEEAPLGSDFLHVTLNSVSIDGVERFIHSWYDQREPDPRRRKEKQESFKTALKEETIRELASVPLILTIMALVNETGPLPRLRTELYETIVDAYIKNREKIRGVVWYDYNEVRAAHEYIAYWMHSRNEQIHEGVDAKTLETILLDFLQKTTAFPQSECLKKAEEFVRLARVRIGLIYEKRLGEFSFGLRPVQEFLAASYINSNSYSVEDLWNYVGKNITNPYWHDIIRFLGGIVGHNSKKGASIFLQKIISYNKAETFVLAAEIASEDILLEWGVREQISDKCLEALTKTSCLNEIQILAESILSLIGTEAKKHILDCLERIAFQDAIKGLNVFYKLALKYNQLQSKTKKRIRKTFVYARI